MQVGDLLQAISALPDEAEVSLSVKVGDLREALENRHMDPERIVGTDWCSEKLGMSREWWAAACPNIPGAFQDRKGAPWRVSIGAARRHLDQYRGARSRSRSRRRGPRRKMGGG